jgi:L-asparaginase
VTLTFSLLETGGTINGIRDSDDPPPAGSRVFSWLREHRGRLQIEPALETVFMKDSRAIDASDRAHLAQVIEACGADRILIPHGTYTMPETGEYLRSHLSNNALRKCILLVGSLIPLGETGSDAEPALGFAIDSLRRGEPGVWIAMQRRLWDPAGVCKDSATGKFIARPGATGSAGLAV